jgi:hypothetical protein
MEDPRAAFSAHLVPSRAGSAKRQSRVGRPGSCARSTEPSGSTSFLSSSKLWLPGLSLRQRHTGKRQCVTIRNHKSLLFGSHTSQTRARAPSAGRRAGGRRKQPQPSSRCWALPQQLVCQLARQGRAYNALADGDGQSWRRRRLVGSSGLAPPLPCRKGRQPNHSVPLSRGIDPCGGLSGTDAAIDSEIGNPATSLVLIRSWFSASPDVDRAAADCPRRAVVVRRRVQALQAGTGTMIDH